MLTFQPLPLSAAVVSAWVLACEDVSLCGMQLYFVSTLSQRKQARESGQKCLAQLIFSCFLHESCCLFNSFVSLLYFRKKAIENTDLQVIIVLSFEANLSDWAAKQRVVNKGCSYPWIIVFYERFSIFSLSLLARHWLYLSELPHLKNYFASFYLPPRNAMGLHGTSSMRCLPAAPCRGTALPPRFVTVQSPASPALSSDDAFALSGSWGIWHLWKMRLISNSLFKHFIKMNSLVFAI